MKKLRFTLKCTDADYELLKKLLPDPEEFFRTKYQQVLNNTITDLRKKYE